MLSFSFNRDYLTKYLIYETLTAWDSFAQWRYSNQWSNREVLLLLVENYTQYPANSTWNTVVYGNFWRLLRKQRNFHRNLPWQIMFPVWVHREVGNKISSRLHYWHFWSSYPISRWFVCVALFGGRVSNSFHVNKQLVCFWDLDEHAFSVTTT